MFHEVAKYGGPVADTLVAFQEAIGHNDMLAYLSMMAPRLSELHRVLKSTGSLWLHCDSTASHYLKLLLDSVFGPEQFLNEIIWKRSSAHSDSKQGMERCGRIHDTILVYTKTQDYKWNTVYTDYDEEYLESKYRKTDKSGRRFKDTDLTAAKPGGDTEYVWHIKRQSGADWQADLDGEHEDPKSGWEYKSITPSEGRFWAYSKKNMTEFERENKIYYTRTGTPRQKQYADEMPGVPIQDIWTDIPPINSQAAERLGYPTQKPEALLERIINSGTDEGDIVLDPFCGCGTTISTAERLNRQWVGIDITHLAISLMKHRLETAFEDDGVEYAVTGEPVDVAGAEALAQQDRFQFEWWALGLVGARPTEQKKGADEGIDGQLYFFPDRSQTGKPEKILFSVKSGKVGVSDVRDLRGVVEREDAAIGVLITLNDPTDPMSKEAAKAGVYESAELGGVTYPRIQIRTIEKLLDGTAIDAPVYVREGGNVTLQPHTAPSIRSEAQGNQSTLTGL
jgi:DNA modification methylase